MCVYMQNKLDKAAIIPVILLIIMVYTVKKKPDAPKMREYPADDLKKRCRSGRYRRGSRANIIFCVWLHSNSDNTIPNLHALMNIEST